MSIRILTKGLKTGTGAGGVKYILRRGLASAAFPLVDSIITFIASIDQAVSNNTGITQNKSVVASIEQTVSYNVEG